MKAADLELAVRDLVSDAVSSGGESYRWTPADLLRWRNDGRRSLFALRPDAFYVETIVTDFPGDQEAADDLDVIDTAVPSLINYIIYRCLSRDNEDPETSRLADGYFQKFINGV